MKPEQDFKCICQFCKSECCLCIWTKHGPKGWGVANAWRGIALLPKFVPKLCASHAVEYAAELMKVDAC